MKFRRFVFLKNMIGIILVITAIGTLVWWEKDGRERLVMESIMIASENIEKGTVIESKHFREIRGLPESTVAGAVTAGDLKKIEGRCANQYIPKTGQATFEMFVEKEKIIDEKMSIFPIKEEWIHNRSSSLRKGDRIDVFDSTGTVLVGTYSVAYVRDGNEQEVTSLEGQEGEDMMERESSSTNIAHVEIVASLEDYKTIFSMAEEQGIKLLLVQKWEG